MKSIGDRIRIRRENLGWTATKLATLAGISQPFLSRIETGAGYSPETLQRIAGALGISLDQLHAERSNITDAPADYRSIPVLDYVQAGRWAEVNPHLDENDIQAKIPINLDCPPSTFALRIRGDSMEPLFREGDDVIINPLAQVRPGDFVVARDETGNATFKQYRSAGINEKGQDVFELVPLNPIYGPLRSDRQHIAIVGVMIEHRKYRRL